MKLRDLAHSRAGDKGNTLNVSLIAYDPRHFEHLKTHVTTERVAAQFAGLVQGEVLCYQVPSLAAMNFVLHNALGGGVTRSLALDAHGKSLSSLLLEMEIADPAEGADPEERTDHEN